MGRAANNPKRYIISCRVDDREREVLSELARRYGTNISGLLRQSLDMLDDSFSDSDKASR